MKKLTTYMLSLVFILGLSLPLMAKFNFFSRLKRKKRRKKRKHQPTIIPKFIKLGGVIQKGKDLYVLLNVSGKKKYYKIILNGNQPRLLEVGQVAW